MKHPDFTQEKAYLQGVLEYINSVLPALSAQKDELDARVAYAFRHMNIDNPEQFTEMTVNLSLLSGQKTKVAQMQYALDKPYFARVDFTPAGEKFESHYIGKMTLLDDLKMLITDWRAPISSLYYEGRIGQAAYDCPDGTIAGDISLKRQYQIEGGKLAGFGDIDITTNDEFLQASLSASKDRRLGDIVATIQAEQNRIIRAPLYEPLIVQGAAGSGKTTIALHRIAYLLYAHEDKLKADQVMIMAPSQFFLSYISDVLPDLGVNQVVQTTFADYVAECLEDEKFEVAPSLSALADAINSGATNSPRMDAARLKSGLTFHKIIDRYCDFIEASCIPTQDFIVEGYTLFFRDTIKTYFHETYSYLPANKRGGEIEKYLKSVLKKEIPQIIESIESEYAQRVAACKRMYDEEDPRRQAKIKGIFEERNDLIKRIQNKSKVVCKQYMKAFALKPAMAYYRELFQTPGLLEEMAAGMLSPQECQLLREYMEPRFAQKARRRATRSEARKRSEDSFLAERRGLGQSPILIENEDLAPLIWIQKRLFGIESDIRHVVIDEAQDLSVFQFIALKAALPRASFSILGDLHQGILAHKGITSWEELAPLYNAAPLLLEQSYRTTIEIMDMANTVIKRLYTNDGQEPLVPLAVPVIRHGDPVKNFTASNEQERVSQICNEITSAQNDGFRSVAIIGKTAGECEDLQKAFAAIGKNIPIVTEQETPYEGGLLILPVYLAKGLEFDVVVVTDAAQYTDAALDVKLLYIACTRALHRLVIGSQLHQLPKPHMMQ